MAAPKRNRAAYEADLQAQQSPYVVFGTPLPPLDPDVRDDGSYVPVWKQEVRDERGRKRLHGAFTGGWSAGYYNTVGSKEGWTPSTFVSSRSNRAKDDKAAAAAPQQRAEDFMDEEDLADAEEARKIQTADAFAGLGDADTATASALGGLAGLLRSDGETMGVKLLKRMGWREGQGVGPKVRRQARLDAKAGPGRDATHLFAPDNVPMIRLVRKTDRKGLGFDGGARLDPLSGSTKADEAGSDSDNDFGPLAQPKGTPSSLAKNAKRSTGAFGIGVLNDTGSDDEDPYEIGPRISYNRVVGGDKKKKKKPLSANAAIANPAFKSKPVFISRKNSAVKSSQRRCHDGRPPLEGFVFGQEADELTTAVNSAGKFPPPKISEGWKSAKQTASAPSDPSSAFVSTADAAKASSLDPKSRAAALGEKQLPGKSVFDFMTPEARDRLVTASGKTNLPPALAQMPTAGHVLGPSERHQDLLRQIPALDRPTALAAIARGAAGGAPYADDDAKRTRYRAFLEYSAGTAQTAAPPPKPRGMTDDDWLREFAEFVSCARIFKPMTGFMASRFTTSSSTLSGTGAGGAGGALVARPPPKPADPHEEAARLGMYGAMTRSVVDFYPTRLLCKRFGVPPPAHVKSEAAGRDDAKKKRTGLEHTTYLYEAAQQPVDLANLQLEGGGRAETGAALVTKAGQAGPDMSRENVTIDADKNEALEGKRAQDDVFRAIFGESDEDD